MTQIQEALYILNKSADIMEQIDPVTADRFIFKNRRLAGHLDSMVWNHSGSEKDMAPPQRAAMRQALEIAGNQLNASSSGGQLLGASYVLAKPDCKVLKEIRNSIQGDRIPYAINAETHVISREDDKMTPWRCGLIAAYVAKGYRITICDEESPLYEWLQSLSEIK